jgi:hypothetical protein
VLPPASSIEIDGRQRVSRGSLDVQVSHEQPIIGTPWEVPVPRNLTAQGPVTAG